MTSSFCPVADPIIVESVYSEEQYQRMLRLVRDKGPWSLILAQHFNSPDEVIATTSGMIPEGFTPTWDMFLSPVFRGYLAKGHTCLYPEVEDCFYNAKFLDLVRGYWGAEYARPESMLFNIQGPTSGGGSPHVDGTTFRGISEDNTPIWLMNMMVKSGLFSRWQMKKAQVIAWYYKGSIGGGFTYWPEGLSAPPKQIPAPMWGRAVVVENEMMYHTAQACGPTAMRHPEGLTIDSLMGPDPDDAEGWQITVGEQTIQKIPAHEFRFLVHWGADIFMDYNELKMTLDHSDDINAEQVVDMLIADLREKGEPIQTPSDPFTDQPFIQLLTRVYDPGEPAIFPPEPVDTSLAA